jgi:hypothetical protein
MALGAGEVAADEPWSSGKLADHAGDEIGLAEAGGGFGEGGEIRSSPGTGRGTSRRLVEGV